MKNLVAQHHYLAIHVLKRKLKATDHHLVHYPTVIETSGPPIHYRSMRSESKHRQLKASAITAHCTKNICKTIASRLQLQFAYKMRFDNFFSNVVIKKPAQKKSIERLPIVNKIILEKNRITDAFNWVEKNGSQYKPNMILYIQDNVDETPSFGKIKYVLNQDSQVYFIYQELSSIFIDHFQAYNVIDESREFHCIDYDKLRDSRPLSLIRKNNQNFIIFQTCL